MVVSDLIVHISNVESHLLFYGLHHGSKEGLQRNGPEEMGVWDPIVSKSAVANYLEAHGTSSKERGTWEVIRSRITYLGL